MGRGLRGQTFHLTWEFGPGVSDLSADRRDSGSYFSSIGHPVLEKNVAMMRNDGIQLDRVHQGQGIQVDVSQTSTAYQATMHHRGLPLESMQLAYVQTIVGSLSIG